MKSDLTDIEVTLHHRTEKAVLVSTDGDKDKAVWVPKSQCEMEKIERNLWVITLPEHVAIDKGLV